MHVRLNFQKSESWNSESGICRDWQAQESRSHTLNVIGKILFVDANVIVYTCVILIPGLQVSYMQYRCEVVITHSAVLRESETEKSGDDAWSHALGPVS
jgi:hypothetical protein